MAWRVIETGTDGQINKFAMLRPDNWHVHYRDGIQLKKVVIETAKVYGRSTAMPNTGPILTVEDMISYRKRGIQALVEEGFSYETAKRFMQVTMYLHPGLSDEEIRMAIECNCIGFKFYPKNPTHGTTGAEYSVPSLNDLRKQIYSIAMHRGSLLVHGEDATPGEFVLDLERRFIERQLEPLVREYGNSLKVVAEHATTKEMVQFVDDAPESVTSTITPQALAWDIGGLFAGGLRASRYCLPLNKLPEDREALVKAATSGSKKHAAGDDSAPHPEHGERGKAKLAECGCAGAYVAPVSVPLYVQCFDKAGALDKRLETFMSRSGAEARGFPPNSDEIVLERKPFTVRERDDYGEGKTVALLCGGEMLEWQVVEGAGPR